MRGPTDEEWKRMSPGERRAYYIFGAIVLTILGALLIEKLLS